MMFRPLLQHYEEEVVDTTHMLNMVLETFSKRVQEEAVKREFGSGKEWNMKHLLENLTLVNKYRSSTPGRQLVQDVPDVGKDIGSKVV
ncbi:hypothetical protein ANCDUO_04234 [Ancylostoma duodenale]|uniref:Uncharacterized protein n=1 Tax=Ancylostoma duodenale TaxID=51022 RepID=A0A0C2H1N3_9BILA|nr:hypothetical protein ANCDUO_04234 [Ancylostoma duodenale]